MKLLPRQPEQSQEFRQAQIPRRLAAPTLRLALMAVLVFLCLFPASALGFDIPEADVNARFDEIFKHFNVTGGTVVILRNGTIEYQFNYGVYDKENSPVTDKTYFRLASVTKMISAMGVMHLYDQGLIDLDGDISNCLGYPAGNPYYKKNPVTLRQIMSHTSSISGDSAYYNKTRTLDFLLNRNRGGNGQYRDRRPGAKYEYANLNGGLLGVFIEKLSGKSVNDYMTETYFSPLGIDAAYSPTLLKEPSLISCRFSAEGSCTRTADGMLEEDESYNNTCDPLNNYYQTVGGLWMRGADLARITYILCKDGSIDGKQFLQPDTIALMRQNQGEIEGSSVTTKRSVYGLNVNWVTDLTDVVWYGHQGMLDDTVCNAYFSPDLDAVVVLLTNGCENRRTNYVANISRQVVKCAYSLLTGVNNAEE